MRSWVFFLLLFLCVCSLGTAQQQTETLPVPKIQEGDKPVIINFGPKRKTK